MGDGNPFSSDYGERALPFGVASDLAEYRDSARHAAARITIKELAPSLNLDPESVHNQFREWDRRKKPSADCAFLLLDDEEHFRWVASKKGWDLVRPAKLDPDESLRILAERASAKGYVSAEDVALLVAQTKKGSR